MEKQNVAPFVNQIRRTFRGKDVGTWNLFCSKTGIPVSVLMLQYREACKVIADLPEVVFDRGRCLIEWFATGLAERFIALETRYNQMSNEEKRILYFQDVLLHGTPSSTSFPRGKTSIELERCEYLLDKRNGPIMIIAKEIVAETMDINFAREEFFKRLLTLAQKTDSDRKPPTLEDANNRNISAFQQFFC